MRSVIRIVALAAALAAALPAAGKDSLKVGALLAITGPASFLGAPEARTLALLAEEMNAKGGIGGRRLELVVKDTGGSPEKAVSLARQLIEEEEVFAIIGPTTSGETLAVKPIAEEGRTLLISLAAAEVIVNPVTPHVFKTAPKDRDAVELIFERMRKVGITRIGLLSSNTGFGKAGKEQAEKLAPSYGIELALSEVYDKAATDLTAEVTKLKAARVQAILNWSTEPAQAIVLKNARQMGMTVPIFQSHGFANVQYVAAAGAAAEGVIFPGSRLLVVDSLPASHPQKGVLEAYKKAYEARYREEVSAFGGHAWDALMILARAVEVGGADRDRVRSAVEGLTGFVGTSGVFRFSPADHNGLGRDAFELLTVRQGRFVPLGP